MYTNYYIREVLKNIWKLSFWLKKKKLGQDR